ncbi:MAG: choice-of-anchor tandem repeat GloVer-containing protein [Candidatus Korobacteraceae bacterium]
MLCFAMCASSAVAATQYKVLYNFVYGADGFGPEATLVFDSSGNLYGTTVAGGTGCLRPGCGVVFELSPGLNGSWGESPIYSFNGSAGSSSYTPVVFDSHGNLYGSTESGGSDSEGTVFELTPGSGGAWTEIVLNSFTGGVGGDQPLSGITLDTSGHLYGTASAGGLNGGGIAFRMGGGGLPVQASVLHSFGGGTDGGQPSGSLASDGSGNLYGTTWAGGAFKLGCVFELVRDPLSGDWTETVLLSFNGSDGANPYGGVIIDAAGNLYGTTYAGGSDGVGTVFKLSASSGGNWSESVLHSFATGNGDGGNPYSGVTFDPQGNLYGATNSGGSGGYGTVFRLTPVPAGPWIETILYGFTGRLDGGWPVGGVVLDSAGNIYGTTCMGGTGGFEYGGVAFEITP